MDELCAVSAILSELYLHIYRSWPYLKCTSFLYKIISCGSSASMSRSKYNLYELNNLCVFLIVHVPGNNGSSQPSVPVPTASGADTPSSSSSQDVASKANRNGSLGTGTSTPTNVKDGTLFFECVSCSRQV